MKNHTIITFKKYLRILNETEIQIQEEKEQQEKLEKEKKLLEARIQVLEIKSKNIDSRISELEYKIRENKKMMEKYSRPQIQRLARLSFPITSAAFISSLVATNGIGNILNLGAITSTLGVSVTASYSIYTIFMNAYQRREKANEIYSSDIQKLLTEKEEINKEITHSKKRIVDIEKQIINSKETTKELEEKLITTIKAWNKYNDKEIMNIPINSKKRDYQDDENIKNADKIKARVLKLVPKDIQKELTKAA